MSTSSDRRALSTSKLLILRILCQVRSNTLQKKVSPDEPGR
jgi:hypothetical protein